MYSLPRRCIFSRSGESNSVWQLLHFQDNPVTFLVVGRGGRGVPKKMVGSLLKSGGGVVVLAPEVRAQMSFRRRNLGLCDFWSLKDRHGVGVRKEKEGEKEKVVKEELCGHQSNWLIQSDFYISHHSLVRSLIF